MADAVLAIYSDEPGPGGVPYADEPGPSGPTEVAARNVAVSPEAAAAASALPQDEVTISVGGQATQLFRQGESISQIASALGETVAVVESQIGQTTLLAGVVVPYKP